MKRTTGKASLSLRALLVAIVSCLRAVPSPAHAATLSLVVLTKSGQPLPGAVITAETQSSQGAASAAAPAPVPARTTPSLKVIVDQVDLAFVPDVSVIPVGASVSFPNSDAVSHQVYSFSSARRFQLPLYRGKQHAPVVFDQPGIVTLGCNIHDNMLAYVIVTKAPYFGRTDARGAFAVPAVPEGSYRIGIWHPRFKDSTAPLVRTVNVGDGGEISLKLDQDLKPAPLKGHPHSWDY